MSDRVWVDYTVERVVGKKPGQIHKRVEGVVDPTKECEAGYMDEGDITPPNSELYTEDYCRGAISINKK